MNRTKDTFGVHIVCMFISDSLQRTVVLHYSEIYCINSIVGQHSDLKFSLDSKITL